MTTYSALSAAAGKVSPLEENEATEDYLKRLVLAVSSLPIPAFEAMPDDARDWFENSCDALSAGMHLPEPDGFDRDNVLNPPAPRIIARPSGSAYAAPPAPVLTYKSTPDPGPRPGESQRDTIIKLLLAEPEMSASELSRRLADLNVRVSYDVLQSQRGFVVTVLRLARAAGWRPPA